MYNNSNIILNSLISWIFFAISNKKLFKDDNDNIIKKEINSFNNQEYLNYKLDEIIKKYIKNNSMITSNEIIELIIKYDKYYFDQKYINKKNLIY